MNAINAKDLPKMYPVPIDNTDEIQEEFFPFLRVYKSGRLQHILEAPFLPSGFDPTTSVVSKDVLVDPKTSLTARLYLPAQTSSSNLKKLPTLVYYHGGGFCLETPFSPTYHPYLNSLVSMANVLAVSVHYRRLPDHPLPAAYDDSWSALSWVTSTTDPWVRTFADVNLIFLAGDSAGANIVHQMARKLHNEKMRVKGVALVHPYFWRRTGSEEVDERMTRVWRWIHPATKGLDEDETFNPWSGGWGLGCKKVAVSVGEKDFLAGRGREYGERAREEGGAVEVWETEGEGHVFHLLGPGKEKAKTEMGRLAAFLNS